MLLVGKKELKKAVELIKRGNIVVFPTETSYGLGCDAANQEAVNKIFKIKGRAGDKPLLVVVPTVAMAKKYLVWNNLLERLAKRYWPGAVTVVGKQNQKLNIKYQKLSNGVIFENSTVALRVTDSPIPKFLSAKLGRPLVATSANIADAGDAYNAREIIKIFQKRKYKPDAVIDGGVLPHRPPTTMVSVVGGKLKVVRQGEVKISNF